MYGGWCGHAEEVGMEWFYEGAVSYERGTPVAWGCHHVEWGCQVREELADIFYLYRSLTSLVDRAPFLSEVDGFVPRTRS